MKVSLEVTRLGKPRKLSVRELWYGVGCDGVVGYALMWLQFEQWFTYVIHLALPLKIY